MIQRRTNPLIQIILIALVCLLGIGSRRYAHSCRGSSPLTPGTRSGRWRHFSEPGWSVEQVLPVGKLKSLETLVLRKSSIADAGLAPLAGLADLRRLSIFNSQVSDNGMEPLRTARSVFEGLSRGRLPRRNTLTLF